MKTLNESGRRAVVAHLLDRAGLAVPDDELDELVGAYAQNRRTAAELYTDDAARLLSEDEGLRNL